MAKRNHNYKKRFHNDAKRHEHDSPEDYREHHHDVDDTVHDTRDNDLVDTRDNREYADDRDRDTGWGWLPLLLIPLFLLGAFLLWPRSNNNNGSTSQTAYVQPPTNSYTGNGTTGPATGVGGAPVTSSVTNPPSAQSTANDQVSNSTNQGPQVGVGGGPGTGSVAQSNTTNDNSNTNNANNNSVPTTSPRTGHGAY